MSKPFETKDEKIIKAVLKTPEMQKHLTQEETDKFDNYSESLLTQSNNPHLKVLYDVVYGKLNDRSATLTLDKVNSSLRSVK
ncbi:hypothetical protein [uncultured Parasutterella sp.]|uniref:hypothetical protein n=1 Tax=uncultured Parasutterella sp. TaxID=1263098 RepID=UPI0025B6394A|nr:hypothetical protein [uncultured Parasutterella sp.]